MHIHDKVVHVLQCWRQGYRVAKGRIVEVYDAPSMTPNIEGPIYYNI
jgi:hypothetical protein